MVILAADHGGFFLKTLLIEHITKKKMSYLDVGTFFSDPTDYPHWAERGALEMYKNPHATGVFICGSGIGMSIAANRYPFLRAALIFTPELAEKARTHNNANVLCLGERYLSTEEAIALLDIFLKTPFEAGRHEKRVEKLSHLGKLPL